MKALRTISRHLAAPEVQRARIQSLLLFIGMPRKLIYTPKNRLMHSRVFWTFWERYQNQLDGILHDARLCYLTAIKKAHPDRAGGSVKQAAQLNAAWKRVQKLFRQHGATLD